MTTYVFAGQWGPEALINTASSVYLSTAFTVFLAGTTTPATLYADRTKGSTVSNPGRTTDAKGNASFFTDPGLYDIAVLGVVVLPAVRVDADDADVAALIPPGTFAPTDSSLTHAIYVSKGNKASDSNDGLTPGAAKATVSAALAAVGSPGTVFLLPGNWTEAVTIPGDNVTIDGLGQGISRITAPANFTSVITATLRAAPTVRNVSVLGTGVTDGTGTGHGIVFAGCTRPVADRVLLSGHNGATILGITSGATTCDDGTVKGCHSVGPDRTVTVTDGIRLDVQCVGWAVEGNRVLGHRVGIDCLSAVRSTVTGNRVSGCQDGIRLYQCDGCTATGNTSWGNLLDGIDVWSSVNCAVTGNTCSSNTNNGVHLNASTGCTAAANTVPGNGKGVLVDFGAATSQVAANSGGTTYVDGTATNTYYSGQRGDLTNLSTSTVLAAPGNASFELGTDLNNGTATSFTTFHTASWTPSTSVALVTVAASFAVASGNADVQAVIGGTTYALGITTAGVGNGCKTRRVRLTGLTPGTPVTLNLQYKMSAGGFYCRPLTQNEFASFVCEEAS